MGQKPELFLDISKPNSAPTANPKSSHHYKAHTNYVDLVTMLRNPTAAEPINKWMATGRVLGRPIGASSPKQKLPKPRRREPKVTAEAYENYFDEDMSGSLSGSMSGYVSARLTQAKDEEKLKKLREDEEFFRALKQGTFKVAPRFEESVAYQKPVMERYPYPKEIYKKDCSDDEYLAHFASLENSNK